MKKQGAQKKVKSKPSFKDDPEKKYIDEEHYAEHDDDDFVNEGDDHPDLSDDEHIPWPEEDEP